MQELIERLESATGPDREIDDAIHELQPMPKVVESLRYTRSIDDALTLVPEGWGARVTTKNVHEAMVFSPDGGPLFATSNICAGGATPAIAICTAALRARSTDDRTAGRTTAVGA
jgi:hypothetical protein